MVAEVAGIQHGGWAAVGGRWQSQITRHHRRDQLSSMGRAVEGLAAMTSAASNQQTALLTFALCADHLRTAELAEQLVAAPAHPVALHQVNCALDALSFLALATVEHMAYLDSEGLTALVRHLAHLGATARWVDRFVPVIAPEADPGRVPGTRSCT